VRLDPARPDAHNMLGSPLARVGRIREALDEFRIAPCQRPDFANARLNLASTLLRAGQFEDAIADYRQVLAALPADQSVRDAVANAAQMREDRGRAMEAELLRHALRGPGIRD